MEKKIGEIFECNGEWYQCVKSNGTCNGCVGKFQPYSLCNGFKECVGKIFKKLEKVGEPIKFGKKLMQNYKVFVEPYIPKELEYFTIKSARDLTILIEIKQNKKEDMKEKKLNLKPFDLEAAKAGMTVCTRDGRKARIICFDRINGDYYKIVACVTAFDGDFEEVLFYGIDGYIVDSQNPKDEDLMMLPGKKEGWVNVYDADTTFRFVEGMVYNTKDEAIQRAKEEVTNGQREKNEYVDTIKISWEE